MITALKSALDAANIPYTNVNSVALCVATFTINQRVAVYYHPGDKLPFTVAVELSDQDDDYADLETPAEVVAYLQDNVT